MNHHGISKYNSYQKLNVFFEDASLNFIWSGFARLCSEIDNFVLLNGKLMVYIQQQGLDITGKTKAKNVAYFNMYSIVVNASKRAYIWAVDNGNKDMMVVFNVTISAFKHLTESEGFAKAKNMRNALFENIAFLLSVELTMADISAIDALIAAYEGLLGVVGNAKTHKEMGTKGIETTMPLMDESLVLIDRLIESSYRKTFPDMVSLYFGLRDINKLPSHHSGISAHIVDSVTGKNLEGASMSFNKKSACSDISGIAEIIKTQWGTYNVTFAMSGYMSQTCVVTISRGRIEKMEVELVRKLESL